MLNYWWFTRPKRKLNSVPEVLACCAEVSLNEEWRGNVYTHLAFEEALEKAGLKRIGERRDRRGSGGRTYFAWIASLGLIFKQESTGKVKLTLAGEALLNGAFPVEILKAQILKYQFPSPFSLSLSNSRSRINDRFKIRPFRFLLRLLRDRRLDFKLSQEEIARIVVTEAENESDALYNRIVNRVLEYRECGVAALATNFFELYSPSSGRINPAHPYSHLDDLANTVVNWLEYTQFIFRESNTSDGIVIRVLPDKVQEVDAIISDGSTLIDRPREQEYFQRKYGLDSLHKKDTRNLTLSRSITTQMLIEQKIRQVFLSEALRKPIGNIDTEIINVVADRVGISPKMAEDFLLRLYPNGAIGAFMTEYFNMAFGGRNTARDFELATVQVFNTAFGFEAKSIGTLGLTPDIILTSEVCKYQGIIDNKASSNYSISNDHHNRMVHNYIDGIRNYSSSDYPLAFFSYIAGGFGVNIDAQIRRIYDETNVCGSAVSVSNIIKMIEINQNAPYTHQRIRDIFSLNRQVQLSDL